MQREKFRIEEEEERKILIRRKYGRSRIKRRKKKINRITEGERRTRKKLKMK